MSDHIRSCPHALRKDPFTPCRGTLVLLWHSEDGPVYRCRTCGAVFVKKPVFELGQRRERLVEQKV
jgi:hypothetical protein